MENVYESFQEICVFLAVLTGEYPRPVLDSNGHALDTEVVLEHHAGGLNVRGDVRCLAAL